MLPCFAMWRRRIVRSMTVLGAVSAMVSSCSSSAPIDMYFGKEAGTGFDAPVPTGLGGATGDGATGTGGTDGGTDGDATAPDSAVDADTDSVDTEDAPIVGTIFNFHWNRPEMGDNQLHYPSYLPNAGRA